MEKAENLVKCWKQETKIAQKEDEEGGKQTQEQQEEEIGDEYYATPIEWAETSWTQSERDDEIRGEYGEIKMEINIDIEDL